MGNGPRVWRRWHRTVHFVNGAEYNALLAQMNPHFLYNTLESISSMAKLSGQEDIVHTIHMLGYLLRASINGNTQKIPLQKELFVYTLLPGTAKACDRGPPFRLGYFY